MRILYDLAGKSFVYLVFSFLSLTPIILRYNVPFVEPSYNRKSPKAADTLRDSIYWIISQVTVSKTKVAKSSFTLLWGDFLRANEPLFNFTCINAFIVLNWRWAMIRRWSSKMAWSMTYILRHINRHGNRSFFFIPIYCIVKFLPLLLGNFNSFYMLCCAIRFLLRWSSTPPAADPAASPFSGCFLGLCLLVYIYIAKELLQLHSSS